MSRFSRTGFTSPYGKLDDAMPGFRVEGSIKSGFTQKRAAVTRKPDAEVIRDFVRVAALGREEAVRMYGESVLVVIRMIERM